MPYKHLKEEIYYSDLYDRLTIEDCRRLENIILNTDTTKDDYKDLSEKDKKHGIYVVHQLSLYFKCAERYMRKPQAIREWMDSDRQRDERFESAQAPKGVHCLKCGSLMSPKPSHLDEKDDRQRVLFFYDCLNDCMPRRAFYDDKEEYIPKPHVCPKCQTELISNDEKNDGVITITYNCPNCSYSEKDVLELNKKEETSFDEHYDEDRKRFCFDKEKGEKARDEYDNLMRMAEFAKELEERDKNKDVYEAIAKIKKLPFGEVQKLLIPKFEENSYTNLQFQPPQMDKVVSVNFTAVDSKTGREERSSKLDLKKLINSILEGTNWRLVQSTIDYRLGFLSGRLQGLSSEEDLKKLVEKKLNEE